MARAFGFEGQSLSEIADYHNDAIDSLSFFLTTLQAKSDPRFVGYSSAEFNALLVSRVEETDLRSSLAILAALEAALRIDYLLRAQQKKRTLYQETLEISIRPMKHVLDWVKTSYACGENIIRASKG